LKFSNVMKTISLYDEKELLIKLQSGDHAAFGKIYGIYSRRIYLNTLKLVKDEDQAQEILQDVFIRIWNARETIDPSRPFSSFLFSIAQNLVRDFFRKAARDMKLRDSLARTGSELYDHIESALDHKETSEILQRAIDALPQQRKMIFTLCRVEGKSYEEVAAIMGISVSTVGNQLTKATKTVRQAFLLSPPSLLVLTAFIISTN
jgi:RNA polymerase sigma-70 factor (family 1)